MPVVNTISYNGARILIWEVNEELELLRSMLDKLNGVELELIVSEKRKLEFLGVRVALKNLLGYEPEIGYTPDGKPFLTNKSQHISVSHSGKWIAVMAHTNKSVGIDVEIPSEKIQKIYTRFLSDTEQLELSNGENLNQLQIAWSAKEALYKIIGKEAVDFAKQLRLFPFEVRTEGDILVEHIPSKKSYQLHYIQQSAYTLVYCLD